MVREVDCQAGVLGSNPGGPKGFPFGITLMVSEVFDELMQVTPGLASESESGSLFVHFLFVWC